MILQAISVWSDDLPKFKTVGNTIRVKYDDLEKIASRVNCRLNEVLAGTATLQVYNAETRKFAYFSTKIVKESVKLGYMGLFNTDKEEVVSVLQGCAVKPREDNPDNLTPNFDLIVIKDKI